MATKSLNERLALQLITHGATGEDILRQAEAFLRGGGRWVQLRMKEASQEEMTATGEKLLPLCREYDAVLIVNDRPEIACAIGADGGHLGKNDASPEEARKLLGPEAVIGCTANTLEDIRELAKSEIDYIGLGPYRFTTTKKNLSPVLGTEGYRTILENLYREGISLPVVAIGGIEREDIPLLRKCGVRYFAASGSLVRSAFPERTTREWLTEIEKGRETESAF